MQELKYSTDTPTLTIIMAAYNCENYIEAAINSILNQSFTDFNFLIIDDCSSDKTIEKIRSFSDKRIILSINSENLGYLKSTNILMAKCTTNYIAFQDADDISHPGRLEKQITHLKKNTNIGLCGTYSNLLYGDNKVNGMNYPIKNKDIEKELNQGRTSLFCGSSIMFQRVIYSTVGGYDEYFDRIAAEDIDWYIRALSIFKGENIPERLYTYRQHRESITKKETSPLKKLSADMAYCLYILRAKGLENEAKLKKDMKSLILQDKKQTKSAAARILQYLINLYKRDGVIEQAIFMQTIKAATSDLAVRLTAKKRKKYAEGLIKKIEHENNNR